MRVSRNDEARDDVPEHLSDFVELGSGDQKVLRANSGRAVAWRGYSLAAAPSREPHEPTPSRLISRLVDVASD